MEGGPARNAIAKATTGISIYFQHTQERGEQVSDAEAIVVILHFSLNSGGKAIHFWRLFSIELPDHSGGIQRRHEAAVPLPQHDAVGEKAETAGQAALSADRKLNRPG